MFNSNCTCGCLNVDVYRIVLCFVEFWFICVYVYYLSYFWLKLLTGLGGQMFFTSGSVMTQVTGLLPQRSGVIVMPDHVEFVVEAVTMRQVFSDCFHLPLLVSFHQYTVLIHSSLVLYNLSN